MPQHTLTLSKIGQLATCHGLDIVGLCELSKMSSDAAHLKSWQDKGLAGEMKFMEGESSSYVATDHILPGTRSVLSFSLQYSSAPHPPCPPGYGRVARYAWGSDYHTVLRQRLAQLVASLEQFLGYQIKSRVFTDALPFLERAAAKSAGLGFIGKNTLLIKKGVGSFFFLGEIFTELEVINDLQTKAQDANGCGSCRRCMNSCPTNAFVAERILDARRCISYLTIEKRGHLAEAERATLADWIFGCDVCQDVCPFNHAALKSPKLPIISEFAPHSGTGPLLDLKMVLAIRTNSEFERIFANTPLLRARRVGLQRNAIAVAVNTGAHKLLKDIQLLGRQSSSEVLVEMARWAQQRL